MVKEPSETSGIWTVPNGISILRFLGIPVLLWAAHQDRRDLFLVVVTALLFTDWLDGKMASVLDQRTSLGARLDSGMDALMYAAVALSFWWLETAVIQDHMGWMLGVLGTWLISAVVALVRFHQIPSYHMWSAKVAWLFTACTVLMLLLTDLTFLLAWTLGLVIFTNLHATAITLVLPRWQADVWSLREALRIRRGRE